MYKIFSHKKLPRAESHYGGGSQVDEEAAEEMGQVWQENPMKVTVQHDVGRLKIGVVKVLGRIGVLFFVPEMIAKRSISALYNNFN